MGLIGAIIGGVIGMAVVMKAPIPWKPYSSIAIMITMVTLGGKLIPW